MSPRRKFAPGEEPLFVARPVSPGMSWRLPLVGAVAAVLMAAAVTLCGLMLVSRESDLRTDSRNREVLSYVTGFMTQFTSIDPYHANDYVTRVLDQATGDFAKQYRENANQILIQIARAEPTTGTVLGSGVERWNDDGSADVIVATAVSAKSPDEKQVVENTNRWTATARQEGKQWRISNLQKVI